MESARNIPLFISEKILEYVPSKDRKNCRLVCYNWCYLIDLYLGFKMKLTRANKASVFYSDLLRCCNSLKICKNAGAVQWYFCPFWKTLQTIEIHGIILVDNWVLLLSSCENLEFVTVTTLDERAARKLATGAIEDVRNPEVLMPVTVNSRSLRRISFIEEDGQMDFLRIARVLNTIGSVPCLRQVLICRHKTMIMLQSGIEFPQFQTAMLSLMARNPPNIINLSLNHRLSSSSVISLWDRLLRDGKNCLVLNHSFETEYYPQIFNKILGANLEILYFSLFEGRDDFVTILNIIKPQCWNLKKLILTFIGGDLDFNVLLGLRNLTELGLHNSSWYYNQNLTNVAELRTNHPYLEYVYVSIALSQEGISHILDLIQLKEFHLKRQKSTLLLTMQHFDKIMNHPRLKFIFWCKELQSQWVKFPQTLPKTWKTMKQIVRKPKPSEITVRNGWGIGKLVVIPEERYVCPTEYRRLRALNFVVLNEVRMDEKDWKRIREDEYQEL